MILRMNIDTAEYKEKPSAYAGAIRNRLCNEKSIRTVTPEVLIECVRRGRTFTPAAMTGTTGSTWQSQQVICADIDNDTGEKDADGRKIRIDNPLTPERAREVMKKYGIDPYFMYYSFSNGENWPKFRIVLILDEVITDPGEAIDLANRFNGIFNAAAEHCADTSSEDNARFFYGGRSDSIFYVSGQTTSKALLQALPEVKEETPTAATRTPAELPKAWQGYTSTASQNGAQRTHSDLQRQFEADKANFDLAAFIANVTTSKPVKKGRNLFFNPCPICKHNDDFQVTGSVYHCHSTSVNGGTSGSVIDFLMNYYNIEMGAACDIFKYEIMKYDRDEWRDAYIAEKYPQPAAPAPATDPAPAADVITAAESAAKPQPAGLLTLERAISILEAVDDHYLEMPGFPQLSEMAKIKTHDTIVIAADTGAGKSSLALNFLHELQDRYPALYINLEMDEATILQRLVAIHTGIELDEIEGYKHDSYTRSKVNAAISEIVSRKDISLLADVYDLKEIERQIQAVTKDRTEPTIVFVDTGLLVTTANKSASRYERFTQISEELRRISRLNNIVMFVLLQQNRAGKQDEKKEPTNSSLKESGSWENDATKIMFLWWNEATKSKELAITKNRSGKTGNIKLNYFAHTQTYKEAKDGFTPYYGKTPFDKPGRKW